MTSSSPSTDSSTGPRRFLRARHERKLAGVCGGLARYFDIDPMLVRIGTVVLATMGGAGVVAYLAAWLLVPYDEADAPADAAPADAAPTHAAPVAS